MCIRDRDRHVTPWHYRATQSIPSMLMLLLWTHICDRYRIIIAGCMYCYWLRGKERERVGVYERDTRAAACPESLTRVPQSVVRTADSQAPVLACMSSLHLRATTRRRLAASYSTNARHLSLNTRAVLTSAWRIRSSSVRDLCTWEAVRRSPPCWRSEYLIGSATEPWKEEVVLCSSLPPPDLAGFVSVRVSFLSLSPLREERHDP